MEPKKIVFVAPFYWHFSAGVRIVYRAMCLLREMGHDVWTAPGEKPNPFGIPKFENQFVPDLVIVPETWAVEANESGTKIARWCLNKPGLLGGPKTYHKNEHVFYYNDDLKEACLEATPRDEIHKLHMGSIDLAEINAFQPRPQVGMIPAAFYVGKADYYYKEHEQHWAAMQHGGEFEISRYWPQTRQQLFRLLHSIRDLHSFDPYTALHIEAHLCGCRVYVPTFNEGKCFWVRKVPTEQEINDHIIDIEKDKAALENMLQIVFAGGAE